jgi:hypothetical protein
MYAVGTILTAEMGAANQQQDQSAKLKASKAQEDEFERIRYKAAPIVLLLGYLDRSLTKEQKKTYLHGLRENFKDSDIKKSMKEQDCDDLHLAGPFVIKEDMERKTIEIDFWIPDDEGFNKLGALSASHSAFGGGSKKASSTEKPATRFRVTIDPSGYVLQRVSRRKTDPAGDGRPREKYEMGTMTERQEIMGALEFVLGQYFAKRDHWVDRERKAEKINSFVKKFTDMFRYEDTIRARKDLDRLKDDLSVLRLSG